MVGLRQTVERLMWPLRRRVALMVGRAVLALVDDEPALQVLQVRALRDETLDGVERFQQYGFTSHPHPDAEVLLLSFGGMRQHAVAVAVDDRRHRPTGLQAGEVCLYTDEDEDGAPHRIVLKRGRVIELEGRHHHAEAGAGRHDAQHAVRHPDLGDGLMPGVVRAGVDTAGGTQLGGGQSWVKIDGAPVVLVGDAVAGHPPCPHVPVHCAPAMAQGSVWVRIDGIPICRAGDAASCGHTSTGSAWVISS